MAKPTWTVEDSIQVREQWEQFEDENIARMLYALGTMSQEKLSWKIARNSDVYEYVATCLLLVACESVQKLEAKKAESN